MVTEKDLQLIQFYLSKNYPVQRIKNNGKFKRCVVFDNGKMYLLSNQNDKLSLKKEMISDLIIVFGFNNLVSSNVISQYLKI